MSPAKTPAKTRTEVDAITLQLGEQIAARKEELPADPSLPAKAA